ncbi:MAG: hypothetical protein ABL873_02270 [Gallionella sp.]
MNQFSKEIEAAFLPTATQYASEGTEPKALVHQWMHALATDTPRSRQDAERLQKGSSSF